MQPPSRRLPPNARQARFSEESPSEPAGAPIDQPGPCHRPGATMMEYLVMLSFLIVVVILAVQHIGNLTAGSMTNSAQKTNFKVPDK